MRASRVAAKTLEAIGWALLGLVVTAGVFVVRGARNLPDLEPWHQYRLLDDFERGDESESFAEYVAREDELFARLRKQLEFRGSGDPTAEWSRYNPTGISNPANTAVFSRNWNRSYEAAPDGPPKGRALLLHGLSDSPYSMRATAEVLRGQGWHVLALRLPGHGTIPGDLTDVSWRDWRAAVQMVARDLVARTGEGLPFIMVGFSNGAALALDYAIGVAEGNGNPAAAKLVFFSPAIRVSPVAALARVTLRIALLPGLGKLAWTSIQPEYDSFKYNSFPVRAAEQIYDLTSQADRRLQALVADGRIEDLPPILAFQSLVDATVPPAAIVDRLLDYTIPNGSELVMFDVNRFAPVEPFMRTHHDVLRDRLLDNALPFHLTWVTNASVQTRRVVARRKPRGERESVESDLGLEWPRTVYSLSHVALPFRPDDPVYGAPDTLANEDVAQGVLSLGGLEPRGERGVFGISLDQMMRLRFNPFFSYMELRLIEALPAEAR